MFGLKRPIELSEEEKISEDTIEGVGGDEVCDAVEKKMNYLCRADRVEQEGVSLGRACLNKPQDKS